MPHYPKNVPFSKKAPFYKKYPIFKKMPHFQKKGPIFTGPDFKRARRTGLSARRA